MRKHKHEFIPGKSNKVALCICGDWKHINLDPKDIVTEMKHTLTPNELRNRLYAAGLYEKEVENIVKAVNSHEALLNACKAALSQLTEDRPEYLEDDIRQLKRAIKQAEGL